MMFSTISRAASHAARLGTGAIARGFGTGKFFPTTEAQLKLSPLAEVVFKTGAVIGGAIGCFESLKKFEKGEIMLNTISLVMYSGAGAVLFPLVIPLKIYDAVKE